MTKIKAKIFFTKSIARFLANMPPWLIKFGAWDDAGIWSDFETWNDNA